jgi:protoporphyrinogen oxidase
MSDEELGTIVRSSLEQVGQPIRAKVLQVTTRRIRHAYPLYRIDYSDYLEQLDTWLAGVPDVLTFGRQGLFSHDNLHHALYMGYRAADCLSSDGMFDAARWRQYRREFETHVVED